MSGAGIKGSETGLPFQGSRVVDESGTPLPVHRGEYGAGRGADPFENTKRTVPSFTRSREVARVYAKHPNDPRDEVEDARLGSYYLDLRNPLDLGTWDTDGNLIDSVVTVEHLHFALVGRYGITEDDLFELLEDIDDWRWFEPIRNDADWLMGSVREVADKAYIEPHHLADSKQFVTIVERAGYDGLHYYGHFASADLFERPVHEVVAEGGYDDRMLTSEEWRPFRRDQVRVIEIASAKFVDEYRLPRV